jgi:hypothetical protein
MSKITELIDSCLFLQYRTDIEQVDRIMKEYAEWYANKCLDVAAKEAEIIEIGTTSFILTNSITDIKLPEHE